MELLDSTRLINRGAFAIMPLSKASSKTLAQDNAFNPCKTQRFQTPMKERPPFDSQKRLCHWSVTARGLKAGCTSPIYSYFFYQVLAVSLYVPQDHPAVERQFGLRAKALLGHCFCFLGKRNPKPYRNMWKEYQARYQANRIMVGSQGSSCTVGPFPGPPLCS